MAEGRQQLSRERILEAAAELAGREGIEGISMRRLAQELDVWPMSVYRYFRDKDELVDAVAADVTRAAMTALGAGDWRTQLHELLGGVRAAIARDPHGLGTRAARAFLEPEMLALSEAGVAILERAGFRGREGAAAWRALFSYTLGSASFSLGDTPDDARRRIRAAVGALPDEDFPVLLDLADDFAVALSSEDEFALGLDLLLDGLEARLRATAR
ncbi:MAG: TetR/AcrR family transcriptional regulator [Thermoleophilaceae bacterium]